MSAWKRIRNGVYAHRGGRFTIKRAEFGQWWYVHGDGKVHFNLSATTLAVAKLNVEGRLANEKLDAKYAELTGVSR